jgi:hypothetical protein
MLESLLHPAFTNLSKTRDKVMHLGAECRIASNGDTLDGLTYIVVKLVYDPNR